MFKKDLKYFNEKIVELLKKYETIELDINKILTLQDSDTQKRNCLKNVQNIILNRVIPWFNEFISIYTEYREKYNSTINLTDSEEIKRPANILLEMMKKTEETVFILKNLWVEEILKITIIKKDMWFESFRLKNRISHLMQVLGQSFLLSEELRKELNNLSKEQMKIKTYVMKIYPEIVRKRIGKDSRSLVAREFDASFWGDWDRNGLP